MAQRRRQPKVGEALARYTARPVSEVFWLAFQSLSEEDQGAFVSRLLDDSEWYEELEDAISIIQAKDEPTRPFDEFEEELERERRQ